MNSRKEYIIFILNAIRFIPLLSIFYFHNNKFLIISDIKRGLQQIGKEFALIRGFIYLFSVKLPFRDIFYYRIKHSFFLRLIYPGINSLTISTKNIGEGLYIQSGFATMIGAESIGRNCTIYQQVTIGWFNGYPTILDNVTIYPGAIIIGKVTIGNNVVIGANATVFMDVPDNCTVLPGSSRIMKWNKKDSYENSVSSIKEGT